MARRRYQHPNVQKSEAADKSKQFWFFRARVDVINGPGLIGRKENTFFLGYCKEMGKREAEQLRDKILDQAVNKPDVVLKSQVKFGLLIDDFLGHMENSGIRTHSVRTQTCAINKHIRPTFGEMRMCDIDHMAYQSWMFGLAKGYAIKTRRHLKAMFAQIWKRAQMMKYTTEMCPSLGASLGKSTGTRVHVLPSVQEFKAMMAILAEPYKTIFVLAAFTGLRISEIRALRWADFQSKNDFIVVRKSLSQENEESDTKTKKSNRSVPVGHLKKMILATAPADAKDTDYIFKPEYKTIHDHMQRAAKAVGIYHIGFGCHTLRRLHNTWFRNSGAAVESAMEQLGHTTAEMNDIYFIQDHQNLQDRSGVVNKLFDQVMFGKEGVKQ